MSAATDLSVAKNNLTEVLGDRMNAYLQILTSWFKQKISRQDFDHEARKLLSSGSVHLHNQFLLAILTKCQHLGSGLVCSSSERAAHNSKTSKRGGTASGTAAGAPGSGSSHKSSHHHRHHHHHRHSSSKPHIQQRFLPADPLTMAPEIAPHFPEPEERGPDYSSREMCLPDIGLVYGRMIVAAWNFGLDDIEDTAVSLLMHAVQMQIKNILSAVLSRRSCYKVREKRFRYAFGSQPVQSHLHSRTSERDISQDGQVTHVTDKGAHVPCLRPSMETAERDASVELATACCCPPARRPISLFNLYDTLQCHKSTIPSHTVYATNMERIVNQLWHQSNEEMMHDELHRDELRRKQQTTS